MWKGYAKMIIIIPVFDFFFFFTFKRLECKVRIGATNPIATRIFLAFFHKNLCEEEHLPRTVK